MAGTSFTKFPGLPMSLLQDGAPQSNNISNMVSPYGHHMDTTLRLLRSQVELPFVAFCSNLCLEVLCPGGVLTNSASPSPRMAHEWLRPPQPLTSTTDIFNQAQGCFMFYLF